MSARLLRAADHARMPWRNGAGVTREIARADDPETGGMLWRVSIADVPADATFSRFPDHRRIISVLHGEGMTLTVDGRSSGPLAPRVAFGFDGAAETSCTLLGGALEDFNLMYDPRRLRARFAWTEAPLHVVGGAGLVLVFAAEPLVVRADGRHTLGAEDALRLDGRGPTDEFALEDAGNGIRAAVIELEPA